MSRFTSVEVQTDLPCWFQTTAQVNNVLSPEFMERQEELVSTIIMIKTVILEREEGLENNWVNGKCRIF